MFDFSDVMSSCTVKFLVGQELTSDVFGKRFATKTRSFNFLKDQIVSVGYKGSR
eukprot:c49762_g1_i1 orf=1-159(-)